MGFALWKMDILGKLFGVGVGLWALRAAWHLARATQHGVASIELGAHSISLPAARFANTPAANVPYEQVTSAYFLHEAVPRRWAAPVLVIEANQIAHAYPRDWFDSEADARRILATVLERADGARNAVASAQ